MEQRALSDARFGEFADKVVLFLHVTSRVTTDPYQNLLREKGGAGFPYVVFLESDGELIAPQPYSKLTVAGFEETLEKEVSAYRALRKKADAGDATARVTLLMRRVEAGALGAQEADAALLELGEDLSSEQRSAVVDRRNTAEVEDAVRAVAPRRMEDYAGAGPAVLKLEENGHVPAGEKGFTLFRNVLIQHALQQKDAKLLRHVVDLLRARYAGNERAIRQIVEPTEKRLADLEASLK